METNVSKYNEKIVNDKASITFDCPSCGKEKISRTRKERQLALEYTCSKCGFVGP